MELADEFDMGLKKIEKHNFGIKWVNTWMYCNLFTYLSLPPDYK